MLITELQMGGAAKMVRELASGLSDRFEVSEAVFNQADGVDFGGDTPVYSLDVSGGGGPFAKLVNFARRVRRARTLKRHLRPDVSISHLEGAHYVDVLSRSSEKIICCVHGSVLHNQDIRGASGRIRRRLAPLIYNRADVVVTVSRGIATELATLGVEKDRLRTINNGFNLARIEAMAAEPLSPEEARLFEGRPVIAAMGRLADQKKFSDFLPVLAGLRAVLPVRMLIAGDGPLRESLLAEARALDLAVAEPWSGNPAASDPDLVFLGVQANPFRFVARSDLYVLPSGWEGFPLALCEAMACRTAVIATDCPTGPREILAPNSTEPATPLAAPEAAPFGLLMPLLHAPADAEASRRAWIEELDRLLTDPERRERFAKAGAERVKDFGRNAIFRAWEELVDELTRGADR